MYNPPVRQDYQRLWQNTFVGIPWQKITVNHPTAEYKTLYDKTVMSAQVSLKVNVPMSPLKMGLWNF